MVRRETDLTFQIKFQSDPHNWLVDHPTDDSEYGSDDSNLFPSTQESERENSIYGSVSLYVLVGVSSRSMQSWRMSLAHPLRTSAGIAGTYLSHLVGNGRRWLTVNLANERTRPARIRTIVELIRSGAIPYCERFREPKQVVASLLNVPDPGMLDFGELEYAVCYGGREAATAILQRYLRDRPDYFQAGYRDALERYRQNGLPAPNTYVGSPTGSQLAFAALALGLEP